MLRILHVDDDPAVLAMVAAALLGNATVVSVGSLAAAQAALTLETFDLLLVDLTLPDAEGVEAIGALAPHDLPIVVLSGSSGISVLDATLEAGAEDYISKPGVTPVRLLDRLRFAHGRFHKRRAKQMSFPKRRRMDSAAFERLKPFISCAGVLSRA